MFCRFTETSQENDYWLTEDACIELRQLGGSFCKLYAEMAQKAHVAHMKAWKGTPKLHLFQHLCEWQAAEWGNPRMYWTYGDEDFVGQMIKTATSCHPQTVHVVAMLKWLIRYYEQEVA